MTKEEQRAQRLMINRAYENGRKAGYEDGYNKGMEDTLNLLAERLAKDNTQNTQHTQRTDE